MTDSAQVGEIALDALGASVSVLETLFDAFDDVVFFVKNRQGLYCLVNDTLVRRLGVGAKADLLGRRVDDLFPKPLGTSFRLQDEAVVRSGKPLRDRLELHLYPGGDHGWCRTFKLPLVQDNRTVGLAGFSKDLKLPASDHSPEGVARAIAYVEANLGEPLRVSELAKVAGMSVRTFERAVRRLFGISAGELAIKARIDTACRLLTDSEQTVAFIAQECGYADHSAFTRQFRVRVGLTPTQYRNLRKKPLLADEPRPPARSD